jgi:hypothetical protein
MSTLKMFLLRILRFILSLFQRKTVINAAPPYQPSPILPPPPTIPEIDPPTIPKIPSPTPPPPRPTVPTHPDIVYTADHTDGFYLKLADGFINELKTDPHLVLPVMANEARCIHATAYNPAGPAYGLIQFFGESQAYIANLDAEQQVPHVVGFYRSHAPYGSTGELYGETFLPARMLARGRSPSTVLTSRGEAFYDQNASLDFNHDGHISIEDLENTALRAAGVCGARFKEAVARLDWAIATLGLEVPGKLPLGALIAGGLVTIGVGLALLYGKS